MHYILPKVLQREMEDCKTRMFMRLPSIKANKQGNNKELYKIRVGGLARVRLYRGQALH